MTENEIRKIVVDAAIAVHRGLGPGLLETVYEIVITHKLSRRWLHEEYRDQVFILDKRVLYCSKEAQETQENN
jgi:GxxExxY protein